MNKDSKDNNLRKQEIASGKTALGIELGSTRIKAVLIDENYQPIASGSYEWENRFVNNIWTYSLDDVWRGLQSSYRNLCENVKEQYDTGEAAADRASQATGQDDTAGSEAYLSGQLWRKAICQRPGLRGVLFRFRADYGIFH